MGLIGSLRLYSGRERVIGCATKKKMVNAVLKNRWTTAEELFHNENINHNNVSVATIKRALEEEGLGAYHPLLIIPLVSEKNKRERVQFGELT
jgi:hypothetical protein